MKHVDAKSQSTADTDQFTAIAELFDSEPNLTTEKINAFPKYATRAAIAKFLTKYELFKQILEVNGSIVECGVLHGGGLLTWAKLSSIFEPANHTRRVIGFDTFTGFPSVSDKDTKTGQFQDLKVGGLQGSSYENVQRAVEVYDMNRPINHIPKVELVKGDFMHTSLEYLEANPHLVIAMLYLDFDIYDPTEHALDIFWSRVPRGGIVVFDELNTANWPGETQAVHERLGIGNIRIKRFPFDSYVSYAVKGE